MEKRIEYKLGENILSILEELLYNSNRVDFASPAPEKDTVVKTGIGGLAQINRLLQKVATESGLQASKLEPAGNVNPGSEVLSYTIPFLSNIKFVLDPAQDTPPASEVENPMLDGFKQSSYHYTVEQGEDIDKVQLVCVGKLPVFKEELLKLIRESKIADKHDVLPTELQKYIMNCLKNLE
jgi:hypothetical protein